MRTAIYCRSSRQEGDNEGSVEEQEKACRKRAASQGDTVVAVEVDRDVSGQWYPDYSPFLVFSEAEKARLLEAYRRHGTKRLIYREGLGRICQLIATGKVDSVMMVTGNRLHRALPRSHLPNLLAQHFADNDVILDAKDGKVDFNDPMSDLAHGLSGQIQKLGKAGEKAASVAGNKARIDAGYCNANPRQYGYEQTGKQAVRIVEEEAAVVVRIFTEFAAGRGIWGIAQALNAEGIPTWSPTRTRPVTNINGASAKNEHLWHANKIKRMLSCLRYIGKSRNTSGEVIDSKVFAAVVPLALFQKVAAKIEGYRKRYTHSNTLSTRGRKLSGILTCGSCGYNMKVATAARRKAEKYRKLAAERGENPDEKVSHYVCPRRFALHDKSASRLPCTHSRIAEATILQSLDTMVIVLASRAAHRRKIDAAQAGKQVQQLRGDIAAARKKLDALISAATADKILDTAFQSAIRNEHQQIRKLSDELLLIDSTPQLVEQDFDAAVERTAETYRRTFRRITAYPNKLEVELFDGSSFSLPRHAYDRASRPLMTVAGTSSPKDAKKRFGVDISRLARPDVDAYFIAGADDPLVQESLPKPIILYSGNGILIAQTGKPFRWAKRA